MSNDFNLGLLMYIPYRAMDMQVFTELADAGFDDITPAQARVFQRINDRGTRLTELAEAAQVTKQTAGFLVDQLERAGYVDRGPDPREARAKLTPLGQERHAAGVQAIRAVQQEIAERMDDAQRAELVRLMRLALG